MRPFLLRSAAIISILYPLYANHFSSGTSMPGGRQKQKKRRNHASKGQNNGVPKKDNEETGLFGYLKKTATQVKNYVTGGIPEETRDESTNVSDEFSSGSESDNDDDVDRFVGKLQHDNGLKFSCFNKQY